MQQQQRRECCNWVQPIRDDIPWQARTRAPRDKKWANMWNVNPWYMQEMQESTKENVCQFPPFFCMNKILLLFVQALFSRVTHTEEAKFNIWDVSSPPLTVARSLSFPRAQASRRKLEQEMKISNIQNAWVHLIHITTSERIFSIALVKTSKTVTKCSRWRWLVSKAKTRKCRRMPPHRPRHEDTLQWARLHTWGRRRRCWKKRVKQLKHVLDTRYMMLIQGLGDFVLCVCGEMWCKSKLGMLKSQFLKSSERESHAQLFIARCSLQRATSSSSRLFQWNEDTFSSNSYFIYLVNFWKHLHFRYRRQCQWNVYQIRLIQNWSFTFM